MPRRLSLSTSSSASSFAPQGSVSRSASLDTLPSHHQYNDDFPHVHFRDSDGNEREMGNMREGRGRGPPAASRPVTPTDEDSPPAPFMKTKRSQSLPSGSELQRVCCLLLSLFLHFSFVLHNYCLHFRCIFFLFLFLA